MLTVIHNAERIQLPLPATLGHLRRALQDHTGLDAFKLIHKGAVMKDDAAPLAAYRVTPTSTLLLLPVVPAPLPPAPRESESALRARIAAELAIVRGPDVAALLAAPNAHEHARVAEALLQALLRLDALAPDPAWTAARDERKAAVRELQDVLDRLDAMNPR